MKFNIAVRILLVSVLLCSLLLCGSCEFEGQASQDTADTSDDIVITDNNDSSISFAGEFCDPDDGVGGSGTMLSIADNGDGTYSVIISIYRLTAQEDGVGTVDNGVLTFVATDDSGNPMTWEIVPEGDHLVATVTDSTWELLVNGDCFKFFPVEEQASQDTADTSDDIIITDNNDSSVSFAGEFCDPDDGVGGSGTMLSIADNGDGTYSVIISIYRLTAQEDGVGTVDNGVLTFVATDDSGNPMTWEIVPEGDHLVATVTDSTWELLVNGDCFKFFPVN